MFKYNEWSDLKDFDKLVKPLYKNEEGQIVCIDENDEECFYLPSDFDIEKKVEDRNIKEEDEEPKEEESENEYIDDSLYDGSELPKENDDSKPEYEDTPEGFYYKPEFLLKLKLKKGIFYKDNIKL